MCSTFHILNLGCKVNRVESDDFEHALIAQGKLQSDLQNADLVIVNTCTVTGIAEKKARKAVRHALANAADAKILVTGCASEINPDEFKNMGNRIEVVPKAHMLERIKSLGASSAHAETKKPNRARVGLKIQDGCSNACTYCIVHVARGPERSMPAESILTQAKDLMKSGVAEIVLAGINLGRYEDGHIDLARLLIMLLAENGPSRFRLSSIEPDDVDDALIDILASSEGRICRHLHLPLQSGSSKVLNEMDRSYDAEGFLALIEKIRHRVPLISLTTDVICGFPGETDEDFKQTLDLCKECGFSKIHVFPYSERNGTPAAMRTDQIASEIRTARASELRSLASALRDADLKARAGTTEIVVVESPLTATTESYHEVKPPENAAVGTLAPLVISA